MKNSILVVDDEKIIDLIDKMLKSREYDTILANNGKEGLNKFLENIDKIKLIISDEMMPRMSGSKMVSEIRKHKPNIPVIFITGALKVVYDGGYLLLRKPFNIIDLLDMVKTVMQSYESGSGEYKKVSVE